jgi:hypothetical protein
MAKTVTNTNIVRRRNLDFDTYERANPESFVDWGQAARDITQTFKDIRDDRKSRKDAIEKGYRERQEALNDIEFYDNPTLQQTAIQASQNASEKLANFNDLMKRGEVSVTDYNLFEHNVKTGFELFQKNALAFDAAFKEYAERTKDDTNAEQERYLAETLKGFANLNNSQISFNAETGNAAFLRVEPPFLENGDKNPKAGQPIKGQSMSLQQMSVFLRQKIDKFDVGGSVKKMVGEIGTLVRANLKKDNVTATITNIEVSKAEQELLDPNNTAGQKILKDKAEQMLTNDQDKMDVLSRLARTGDNEFGKTADGVPFRIGSAEEYEAYGGPEENNPILVFEQGTDGLAQPKLNKFQKEQAIKFGMEEIKTALSSKQTTTIQKIQKTIQYPPDGYYRRLDKKERIQSLGRSVNMLVTGDKNAKESAAGELISRLDGLNDIQMDTNGNFIIYTTGNQPFTIEPGNKDVKEVIREIYNVVGDEAVMGTADQYFDANGEVGPSVQIVGFKKSGVKPKVKYRTGPILAADGKTKIEPSTLVYDELGNTLNSVSDPENQVQAEFQGLINNNNFFPKELKGKVDVSNSTLSVNIDGKNYVVATDIYGDNDNVKELVNKLQLKIKEAVEGTGGSAELD